MCGLIDEINPVHIVAGDTFQHGLLILSLGYQQKIILSEQFKAKLDFFGVNEEYHVQECDSIKLTVSRQ